MKTAVIYARYSCDSQTEQSIEGQIRVCKQYAANNDMVIVEEYIDRAMSGTNDNRAAFQKMLQDSSKNQFSVVLVYKLDRFSRNKYESVVHKKTLKDHGVKLVSAMENIPDSPEGTLMESLLEGFNQYYSEELTQKVNRGLRESWLKGNITGGRRLFGYDVIDKKCVINEGEANIIREIFTKYAQNYTSVAITEYLNDKGVLRPNGLKFKENYVRFILHNPRYAGKVEHQGVVYTNIFPPIISESLWKQVDAINETNKFAPSHKKDCFNYLLTGKLVCGLCKHKMFGESGTSRTKDLHYYYTCSGKRKKKLPCNLKSVQKQLLEDAVINTTTKLLSNKSNVHMLAEQIFDYHSKIIKDNTTLRLLAQKKTECLKSIKNLVSAIEQGIISEFTKSRLAELENELTQLEYDISVEQHKTYSDLTIEKIENYLQSHVFHNTNDISVRKLIINTLIREIIYYPDKLIITYNFTNPTETIKIDKGETEKIEKQCETAYHIDIGSSIKTSVPPNKRGGKMKNYFIIHGSFGSSQENWFPWLEAKLKTANAGVFNLDFPVGYGKQTYDNWEMVLNSVKRFINEESVFFCHSISCIFLVKYCIRNNIKIGKAVFVSGFNHYLGIDDEFDDVNCTMYTNKIAEFKNLCKERICFYSTNDPYVKFDALQSFAQDITATQKNVSKTAGHFNKAAGYTKFEELLKY